MTDTVEIAVDVEFEQIARRIAGAARHLRCDAFEPGCREIEPVDEGVDEPNRIVRDDIIIHRLRQQQKLRAFESRNVSHARFKRGAGRKGIGLTRLSTRSARILHQN